MVEKTPAGQNPDSKSIKKADDKSSSLGISRGVYALGNSLKDALIWGTALSVALIGAIAIGRDKSKAIRWVATKIEAIHTGTKGLSNTLAKLAEEKAGLKFNIKGPEVAAALGVGWLFGHVVQGPSFVQGFKKAQTAVDKYNDMADERTKLVDANAQLIDENQRYKTELEKRGVTFTELVQQKSPEASVGNSR